MRRRTVPMRLGVGLLIAWVAAAGDAGERILAVEPSAKEVKRYERLDFSFRVQPVFANPYDPEDVDLSLEITAPGGQKILLPAFFYQHHERGDQKKEWLYPAGLPTWKARFAPAEVGTYSCVAVLSDRAGTLRSEPAAFACVASQGKGYLRVSKKDPRFLEFDDGSPFFGVGQNVAFITDSAKYAEMLRKLGESGVNFVRVWACCEDWAMGIEARKSAWGRSWGWAPPIVALPGREGYHSEEKCLRVAGDDAATIAANPCHAIALRPNTRYEFFGSAMTEKGCGLVVEAKGGKLGEPVASVGKWSPFKREFTAGPNDLWLDRVAFRLAGKGGAWIKSLSLKEAGGGPEMLWEADPNRPTRGVYNPTDCAMLDTLVEAAEKAGIYLELTLLTRDHYMDTLRNPRSPDYARSIGYAKKLLRYAVARWGYSTHVALWEYFNEIDPGLPTARFYAELGDYLEQIDPYRHLRSTSCWGPSGNDPKHPKLDVGDHHYYMRPANKELFKDDVAAVLKEARLHRDRHPAKPALFSEFGLANDQWGLAPEFKQDTSLVHLHNALWASALSGVSTTVMPWWWDDYDKRNHYPNFKPVAAFVADIPFTTAKLQPLAAEPSDKSLRLVGLQGKGCAYFWVSNPQATWWNLAMEKATPSEINGASVTLQGLEPGTYRIQWWDTFEGKAVKDETATAAERGLAVAVPAFSRDIACKVVRQEH